MPSNGFAPLDPQVWIPSVFPLDAPVFRQMTSLISDRGFDLQTTGKSWSTYLSVTDQEVQDILLPLSPALTALFLAGYRVPHIDIGFRRLPDAVEPNGTYFHPTNGHWLRFDLAGRQVDRLVKSDDRHKGKNLVRMQLLPITRPEGQSLAVPLTGAVWDELVAAQDVNDGGTAMRDEAMQSYMNRVFQRYPMVMGNSTESIAAYRKRLLTPLLEDQGTGAELIFDLDFGFMSDPAGNVPPGTSFVDAGDSAKDQLFAAIRLTLFDTITWFAGQALIRAANELNTRNCLYQSDPDGDGDSDTNDQPAMVEDEGLYDEQTGPTVSEPYPGMLWVLDPDHWQTMATGAEIGSSSETAFGLLEGYCRQYSEFLNACGEFVYSDLLVPTSDDLDRAADPPAASRPVEEFFSVKTTGLLDAKFYAPDDALVRPEIGCTRNWQTGIARFLDVQLGVSTPAGRSRIKRIKRRQARAYRKEDDGRAYCNPTFQGMLADSFLATHDSDYEAHRIAHLRTDMRALDRMLDELAQASKGRGKESMAPPPKTKLAEDLGGADLLQQVGLARYVDVLLALFNFGYFSIAHVVGDLNAGVEPRTVRAELETERSMRLVHSHDPGNSILIAAHGIPEGTSLANCVAWQFMPKPDPITDETILAEIRMVDAALAQMLEHPEERLVIVAAPGVKIDGLDSFLVSCTVEIHRVQSVALVPDPGDPINAAALLAPRALSVLSDMEAYAAPEPFDENRDPPGLRAIIDGWKEKPQTIPLIHVAPLKKPGWSGVVLTAPGMPPLPNPDKDSNAQDNPQAKLHPYRGKDGQARVTISVPNDGRYSHMAKFAFGFRYRLKQEFRRNGERHAKMAMYDSPAPEGANPDADSNYVWALSGDVYDIVQYELIIFKTPSVNVSVADSNYSYIANRIEAWDNLLEVVTGRDPYADLFDASDGKKVYLGREMTWHYHVYDMPMDQVPEQGTPLTPPDLIAANAGHQNSPIVGPNERWLEALDQAAMVSAAQMTFDVAVGFIPLVGEAADLLDIMLYMSMGTDRWGNKMTRGQFYLTVGGLMLPVVSSAALRGMRGGGDAIGLVDEADEWLKLDLRPGVIE
ncbi:hypothetical protein [Aestuariivita boseongensis]|uniref:hypothetical protein n=1 Tax=Aestuariivita boseongensis TaxID=1470562 RepID=UPI000680D0E7|nr:hypothetical protein [Aestuariivita boseongensis]